MMEVNKQKLGSLFQKIKYNFKNIVFCVNALTHSSYNNEKNKKNYQRLEFLGDRVLGLIISEAIFKKFKNEEEGKLSKRFSNLVSKKALIEISKEIELQKILQTSKEFNDKVKITDSMLADSLEALIGAIYIDSNFEEVKKVVLNLWCKKLSLKQKPPVDAKSFLQEWCLSRKKKIPIYKVLEKKGPDHKPTFLIALTIENFQKVKGEGSTKKNAEIDAAQKFIEKIK
ncbi:MAG: ribonuclease III [Rickettsiales bacterium]|nr:ribonuclease III [Rickettsiales bacterium]